MKATSDELSCLIHNSTYDRLSCLNNVKARLYLPVTIFLALLIIIGTIGNTAVCLVYLRRRTRVSSHYFILALAALDLMTCVVGMPTEIADLLLPYTFESPWACKVLRFTHSSTIIASSTILIQVAFDRYYRICHLGRQFTANKAKFLCVGALILGFICSWPTFVLFGRKTITRRLGGHILKGTDCSTDDSMQRTIYPTIYYIFLFSLFGITVIFFAILYSKIGLTIIRRKKFTSGSINSVPTTPKHAHRSNSRQVNVSDPASVDISSGPGDDQGNSTASSSSSTSHCSTSTSSTRISGLLLYGNLRRFCKRWSDLDGEKMWQSVFSVPSHDMICRQEKTNTHPCDDDDDDDDAGNKATDRVSNTGQEQNKKYIFYQSGQEQTQHNQLAAGNSSDINHRNISNSISCHNNSISCHCNNISNSSHSNNICSHSNNISNSSHSNNISSHSNNINSHCADIYSCGHKHMKTVSNVRISASTKTRIYVSKNVQERERVLQQPLCRPLTRRVQEHVSDSEDEEEKQHTHQQEHQQQSAPRRAATHRQIRVGKTTTVLFAVTLAYILSFLPYLTVMILRSVIKDLEETLSPVGELAYKLCVKSFFINNAINPLIYSFLNQAFRQDASQMLTRMCGGGREKKSSRVLHHGDGGV